MVDSIVNSKIALSEVSSAGFEDGRLTPFEDGT